MQRQRRIRRAKEKRRLKGRIKGRNPIKPDVNNNLKTVGIVSFVVAQLSDVRVLQALVVVLLLILVIYFCWNNVLNQGLKKVGRIEFSTDDFIGKGCLGTSVFQGTFDGRNVAVKVCIFHFPVIPNNQLNLQMKLKKHN